MIRNKFFVMLQIFLEQKKMLKTGLNIAHFKEHVKIIEAETREYFQRWGDSGERSKIFGVLVKSHSWVTDTEFMRCRDRNVSAESVDFPVSDLFEALSELIILTASSCLHGKEIRSMLDERVAQLYADLDGGFTHAAWLLPGWLPLPSFRWGCWRLPGDARSSCRATHPCVLVRKRDRAHQEIKNIFFKVIQKRRQSGENIDDILQTLIDATYK